MNINGFIRVLIFITCCIFGAGLAQAHHSFPSQYDSNQPATIEGLVVNVEWRNPHVYFYMDVFEEDGSVTQWAFEMSNISAMRSRGWSKDTLQVGDMLRVDGFLARDGSPLLNADAVYRINTDEQLLGE